MRLKKSSLDNIVLVAGAIFFLWFLTLPKPGPEWVYLDTIKYGATTLKGEMPFSDFAAMVVGFRALYHKTDPYPRLSEAFKELGIDWPVGHGSNHPPTSYLLAAPVALMPWPQASAVWAWMMLGLIVFSFRFYGLSWRMSLGLMPLTMLWPPASASLGQVTIVWMFGIAMAYHFRRHRRFWSGASLGLASLSKYMPGLLVIIYLVKRKWRAVLGFLSVWIFSLSLVTLLNSAAIPRYFEENRTTTFALMQRTDNSAPLIVSYRYAGLAGVVLLLLFFALVVYVNRRYFYEWKRYPSTRIWMLLSYLAIACLPIFWIYSLMPLIPVLFYLIFQRKIATTVLCLLCLLIPSIYIRGGEQSVIFMASVSLFTGLAFILDVLPFKVFQRRWHSRLRAIDEMNPDSKSG
jgi:hypothetical protein